MKKKKQNMFYVEIPKAGEYKPFVNRKQNWNIIDEHVKSKKKK
jgi:hypothetical protein